MTDDYGHRRGPARRRRDRDEDEDAQAPPAREWPRANLEPTPARTLSEVRAAHGVDPPEDWEVSDTACLRAYTRDPGWQQTADKVWQTQGTVWGAPGRVKSEPPALRFALTLVERDASSWLLAVWAADHNGDPIPDALMHCETLPGGFGMPALAQRVADRLHDIGVAPMEWGP
jgi:hypothetical protein